MSDIMKLTQVLNEFETIILKQTSKRFWTKRSKKKFVKKIKNQFRAIVTGYSRVRGENNSIYGERWFHSFHSILKKMQYTDRVSSILLTEEEKEKLFMGILFSYVYDYEYRDHRANMCTFETACVLDRFDIPECYKRDIIGVVKYIHSSATQKEYLLRNNMGIINVCRAIEDIEKFHHILEWDEYKFWENLRRKDYGENCISYEYNRINQISDELDKVEMFNTSYFKRNEERARNNLKKHLDELDQEETLWSV